ncbi:MAG: fasciclin domain-containing protein, partial [Planctomycetota bacterium]
MRLTRTLLVSTLLVTFVGSPLAWGDDIVSTAAATGNFRTLVNLLVLTGLDDALSADGHYTVFAPSDNAFNHLPSDTLESLRRPENRDQLTAILKYHVVDRALQVPRHPPSHPITEIASLEGSLLNFSREGA